MVWVIMRRGGYPQNAGVLVVLVLIGIFRSSHDNALRWMPQDLTDDKSTLAQVMAWCLQQTITWANFDSVPCRFMALLGHNELMLERFICWVGLKKRVYPIKSLCQHCSNYIFILDLRWQMISPSNLPFFKNHCIWTTTQASVVSFKCQN